MVGHHDGHMVPSCPGGPSMGTQVSGSWQLYASILPVQVISVRAQIVGQNDGQGAPGIPFVLFLGIQVCGKVQPFSSIPPGHSA